MNENFEKEEITEDVEFSVSYEKKAPDWDELAELISEKRLSELRRRIDETPPPDLAILMESAPREARGIFYRLMHKDIAAEVFVEMDPEMQAELIEMLTDAELSETLKELYIDDTVDIIEEMPALVVKRIIRSSTPENRESINRILCYPKDSAGTIMTTEYVKLPSDITVGDALEEIRRVAIDKETIYTSYITDKDNHLIGLVTARSLMLSAPETPISDIIEERVIFANTTEDKEEVARKFDKYGFIALPVVDNECRLVGIVTVDDAMEVIHEETEEDFAKMAAIIPSDKGYLKTDAFSIFKTRIPWLLLLMVSATVSSSILSFFEASLLPVLVLFVPMLMDTGGNSGSQASVTAIRALSLGEIKLSDVLRVLWKEIRVGLLCGVSLGIVAFGKIMLVDRLIMGNPAVTVWVAIAVSASLAATVLAAKIIGGSLPLLAKRLGLDPAVMASPLITTLVDAVGLILYFVVSAYAFGLTL